MISGREIRKVRVQAILGEGSLDIGEAEILVEDGHIVKVISFTHIPQPEEEPMSKLEASCLQRHPPHNNDEEQS